ncbi:hypothetical protein F5887DRAFT_537338 [Amanita rubescens]|nr:hypothetical protein F5887DRAFT_537338 [Amanita rubescens]
MCFFEVFGDLYRGCGCFKKSYYSGEKDDCQSPNCRNSSKHIHRAPNCLCEAYSQDKRRIINLFQAPCDD